MTKAEFTERAQFEKTMCAESEGSSALSYMERERLTGLLMRHGRTYHRIQELICNGVEWGHEGDTNESFNKRRARHEAWCEKREQQLERRIREIVAQFGAGFGVTFSGDPRGVTVKVTVPSGKSTGWGGDGVCVPGA